MSKGDSKKSNLGNTRAETTAGSGSIRINQQGLRSLIHKQRT